MTIVREVVGPVLGQEGKLEAARQTLRGREAVEEDAWVRGEIAVALGEL
ncbi:MAG TPA: hypothetical protein VGB66_17340 [Longimicrobium sp.]|jgi:hypothetical protein